MSAQPPLVGIVTPVYNGAAYLAECIESVLRQTYSHWEYVILDNASTDATGAIAGRYAAKDARIRVVRNDAVLPVMQNWNAALAQMSTTSRYCKVVHADDALYPECVERMVTLAERFPSVGLVGCQVQWGRGAFHKGDLGDGECFDGRDVARRTLGGEIYPFLSPSGLLIRADLIRERGRYYSEDTLYADVEACYETLMRWDFGFVARTLVFVRRHEGSLTSTATKPLKTLLASNLALLARYGPQFLTEGDYRRRLEEVLDHYYMHLARAALARRERRFWTYHRAALAGTGQRLSLSRLGASIFAELTSRPRDSLRRLAGRAQ